MGSYIEINDTLQITTEQGFPADLFDRESHIQNPVKLSDVESKVFSFYNKPRARIFHLDPVRVYYVHNINGKWLFWGRIFIESQKIEKALSKNGEWDGESWVTSGTYKIIDVYNPEYQESFTTHEAPLDRNYFISG